MSQQQQQQANDKSSNVSGRPRRPSEASSQRGEYSSGADDDSGFGSLTPALELEIQGHHRELGSWGVGDDLQMGLE